MSNERLTETVTAFRVARSIYEVILKIKKDERRTVADIARALLERGVAAYERDGRLFEPAGHTDNGEPETIIVKKHQGGRISQAPQKRKSGS